MQLVRLLLPCSILFAATLSCSNRKAEEAKDLTTFSDIKEAFVDHPPIKEVEERFRARYSVEGLFPKKRLRFEKRIDGWYVSTVQEGGDGSTQGLFWDPEEGYKDLDLKALDKGSSSPRELQRVRKNYGNIALHSYRSSPLYGYPDWQDDLIDLLKDRHPLSDSLAYALGRAYGDKADKFIAENGLSLDPGAEQLDSLSSFMERSIALFDTAVKRSDDFETFIGNITTKRDNEMMHAYLELWALNAKERARQFIEKGAYSPFIRSVSKARLNNCDSNAVLLTNGDNDTYPLIYMQVQHGVRPDVKVINVAIMTAYRYARAYWEPFLEADGLERDISLDKLLRNRGDPVPLKEREDADGRKGGKAIPLKIFLTRVGWALNKEAQGDQTPLPNAFTWDTGSGSFRGRPSPHHLSQREIMILDLFRDREKGRPLHYLNAVENHAFLGLRQELPLVGLLHRSEANDGTAEIRGKKVDLSRSYELLTEELVWDGVESIKGNGEKAMAANYFYHLSMVLHGYIEKNKNEEKALNLLNITMDRIVKIPEVAHYEGVYMNLPLLARDAYKLGEAEKGDEVLIHCLKIARTQEEALSDKKQKDLYYRIWSIAEDHDRQKVKERFEEAEIPER